jgi:hypothetical protein
VPCDAVITVAFRMSVSPDAAPDGEPPRACAEAATQASADMIASVSSLFILFSKAVISDK